MKFNLFRKREPTKNELQERAAKQVMEMVTTYGEHYYEWNGKLYQSDIVRSCIRPKVKAIGKLVGKHIRDDPEKGLKVNPSVNMRFLLSEPNPYMTGQQMQEKVANQLCLNNNAFILIVKNDDGIPVQLYPIPCTICETIYKDDVLYLKFQFRNGKSAIFPYSHIIHLRQDYNDNDIFGESPAAALSNMMEVVGTIDQGIVKAIKNSNLVRWLLTFNQAMRDEDVKKNVKKFVDNYMSVESDTWGAAGVDAKATVQRIEPKDYVPNSAQMKDIIERIYSFFNTNKKIVQSEWTEDEWNAYYEAEIEPCAIQMSETFTCKLFTRKERGFGNKILFEASNLQCASLSTKLAFQAMVDRGAMTPNEWRGTMNMSPIEGGDQPIRRLDTQVVGLIENALGKINSDNYVAMTEMIKQLLMAIERRPDETQNQY